MSVEQQPTPKMTVFCDVASCTVVDTDRRFGAAYRFHHQWAKAQHPRRKPSSYSSPLHLTFHLSASFNLFGKTRSLPHWKFTVDIFHNETTIRCVDFSISVAITGVWFTLRENKFSVSYSWPAVTYQLKLLSHFTSLFCNFIRPRQGAKYFTKENKKSSGMHAWHLHISSEVFNV